LRYERQLSYTSYLESDLSDFYEHIQKGERVSYPELERGIDDKT